MADREEMKRKALAALSRQRASGVGPLPGFGALFCFALTKALVEPPPLGSAELMTNTLRAPMPPVHCPVCAHPAVAPVRDPSGDWTWNCAGGCNP